MQNDQPISTYINNLPAVFQQDPFIDRFLAAFEAILSGLPGVPIGGLEELIDRSHTFFDPISTPEEFLPWLAGWVALTLRPEWDEKTRRQFIQKSVVFYQQRGTQTGLEQMLDLCIGGTVKGTVTVDDDFETPEHYFQVEIILPHDQQLDRELLRRKLLIARDVIDQEKPAHTIYALHFRVPTIRIVSETLSKQINKPRLQIGTNTYLGSERE